MTKKLEEGIDFYYNDEGLMVLTKEYLIKRGFCCQSGCLNCPYNFSETVDPNIPLEFQTRFEEYQKEPEHFHDPEYDDGDDDEEKN